MAIPPIEVDVRADTAQAEAGIRDVKEELNKLDGAAKKAGQSASSATAPVGKLGGSMRATSMHTANLTAQFNDIGVMMAAGQSPLQLAMQQGTQINQVFQQMGGSGREALRAIGGGLTAMINPMSLMTIGVIAGAAALVQWARNAGEAADEVDRLAERVEAATERLEALRLEARELRLGVTPAELALMDQLALATASVARAQRMLDSSPREAQAAIAREQLKTAIETRDAIAAQLAELRSVQTEVENLKDGSADLLSNFQNLIPWAEQFAIATGQAAENLLVAARNAAIAEATKFEQGRGDAGAGGPGLFSGDRAIASMGGMFIDRPDNGGGSGGSVGGVAPLDTTGADIERLQEQLMTETEAIQSAHEERLELLRTARENELLTKQEYDELETRIAEDHARELIAIDVYRHGTTLQQTSQFLGDMAGAFAAGNEEMLRISKVFGAGQAFVNSMIGASEALKLPFPANIAAAAKVVATGAGFIASIKGASAGGGSAAAPSAAASVPPSSFTQGAGEDGGSAPQISRSVTLIGESGYSRQQVEQLIEFANEGQDNGIVIRGRR